METKDLKKLFKDLAKKNGFESAFGIGFKQSEEGEIYLFPAVKEELEKLKPSETL